MKDNCLVKGILDFFSCRDGKEEDKKIIIIITLAISFVLIFYVVIKWPKPSEIEDIKIAQAEEIKADFEWVKIEAGDDSLCLAVLKNWLIDPAKEYYDEYIWELIINKNKWGDPRIHKGDNFFIPIKKTEKILIQFLKENPVVYTPTSVRY